MVYRFIDEYKDYFGLRWLCRHFGISATGYYNYLKDKKSEYREQREIVFERIKYIFYNNKRNNNKRIFGFYYRTKSISISKRNR